MRVRFPLPAYEYMSLKPTKNQRFEAFYCPKYEELGGQAEYKMTARSHFLYFLFELVSDMGAGF
ncbi:hypothetical protein C7B69_15765 [filamentous cyanobacterium Phorm 46]|nr:hypothetical protein C7B69_15765 [filamentous cyanobacterium Phorm 46]PSB43760.1 hypothetical protein C7B67_23455 [filamentous cyanobacterium Phorm 6]